MPGERGPDDEPLKALEEQLRRDDPGLAQRMSGPDTGWVARRCLLALAVLAGGLALLIFGESALGIGAVVISLVLIFIGAYELPMRIMQLRRLRRASRPPPP